MTTRSHRLSPLWFLVGLGLMIGAVGGVLRGLAGRPNWGSLQREAAYVWTNHETAPGTAMFGYLPTAVFALWPFMVWTPQPLGLGLYVLCNVLAAAGTFWCVHRWWLLRPVPVYSYAWPVLLTVTNFAHVIQGNQLTLWALFLSVAGLALAERGRPFFGGVLVGAAGLVKCLPFLLVGYLLLRRRWRALAGVVTAILLLDIAPSVVVFGWNGAVREHRAWLQRAEWHSARRQIEDPLQTNLTRHASNFSYASVLARWLRRLPNAQWLLLYSGDASEDVVAQGRAALRPDETLAVNPMPSRTGQWRVERISLADVPRFHVADLSAGVVRGIWAVSLAIGMGALAWLTWRTGRDGPAEAWPALASLWMLAMFWVTPMMRPYYLAMAFPAVVVVWQMLIREAERNGYRWTSGTALAAIALLAWPLGLVSLGWHRGRWYGIHLAVLAILIVATAWSWRRIREAAHAASPRARPRESRTRSTASTG